MKNNCWVCQKKIETVRINVRLYIAKNKMCELNFCSTTCLDDYDCYYYGDKHVQKVTK